ncbi:MAG: HD domain-containing phosphohydrolase [Pseudomonadales bacterium]|nr:HD domain-containing phosphohydrolase [Pseudomonadales bacterium]
MFEVVDQPVFVCVEAPRSVVAPVSLARDVTLMTWSQLQAEPRARLLDTAVIELEVDENVAEMRRHCPHALFISSDPRLRDQVDFVFSSKAETSLVPQVLDHALSFWHRNRKIQDLGHDVAMRRQRMHQLNEISIALTGQMSQQELLRTILSEARRIAHCEAGSLFLIEPDEDEREALVFKLAQNDIVEFPFVETRLELSSGSIAGYVAVTGKELNIKDVYRLSDQLPYHFNHSFDEKNGYRTQSVLTLPMRDYRGRVVGILQFLNRVSVEDGVVVPFEEEIAEILRAIASQAAMSVQKNALIEDINRLFESFVQASVKTIEQRDPSMSGHSFRVAETTVDLLRALPESGNARFSRMTFTPEHIREVRYAALLHDFGKIGVPEAVLVKAKKLTDERVEVIGYRIELQKERLRRRAVEQELELLHHQAIDQEVARRRVHHQLEKQLSILDQYYDWVRAANNPNILDAGSYSHLDEIRDYAFRELDGTVGGVITEQDLLALSVRRGSLTPEERRKIQAHVVFTTDFLSVLPWPPELAQVPDIAGAHHERIDGSGYPRGLVAEQIPLASRVMAVCDVFDALTAMDRPYKPSMSDEVAYSILEDEGRRGLLDQDMVQIFIDNRSSSLQKVI